MNITVDDNCYDNITEENIMTGIKIYSAMVFCSREMLQSYRFIKKSILDQSLNTLLISTVNTIESEKLKEYETKKAFNQFYHILRETYDLRFGDILLLLSSPSQLNRMIKMERPYFNHEQENCIIYGKCNISLGKFSPLHKKRSCIPRKAHLKSE